MIQTDEAIITNLIAHRINSEETHCVISNHLLDIKEEEIQNVFARIFLKPFATNVLTCEFAHEVGLDYNVLFKLSKAIHENGDFIEHAQNIARNLIAVSKHPNIKDGDLFIAKLDGLKLGNGYYEGLGIYKFEDKESYIETESVDREIKFQLRKGLGAKKPDKACLIIFADEPYTLLIIDSSSETDYWQNEFIKHKPKNDFINSTSNFLSLTKDFITKQIPQAFEVSKADQIDLLNRSINYFKTREKFDKSEFEEEVFLDKNVIKSFRSFDEAYGKENAIELADSFDISAQAVKKQARVYKSVLKLDKNFHIYIHGNRDMIEQGVEKDGRKFYKIYFDKEE